MALWRVRATVADRPGFLAVLAASLALRSVNILSVGVHVTEAGAVDDFLVDAPEDLTEPQLLAAVERGRGRDAWVARAEAHSLVDAPTRALDLATFLVREPASTGRALGELLAGRASWQPAAGADELGVCGTRMWVPAPTGGAWLVERPAPSFTPAEYARAQALLAVAAGAAPREGTLLLPAGQELTVRPATAGDLAAVREMHARCAPARLRQRYLTGPAPTGPAPTDAQLARLLVPARGVTLLAEVPATEPGTVVVAVANLVGEGVQAEIGLLVADGWQRRGIGTALLRRLVARATDAGFEALVGHARAENTAMPRTLRRVVRRRQVDRDGDLVTVTVPLARRVLPATPHR